MHSRGQNVGSLAVATPASNTGSEWRVLYVLHCLTEICSHENAGVAGCEFVRNRYAAAGCRGLKRRGLKRRGLKSLYGLWSLCLHDLDVFVLRLCLNDVDVFVLRLCLNLVFVF